MAKPPQASEFVKLDLPPRKRSAAVGVNEGVEVHRGQSPPRSSRTPPFAVTASRGARSAAPPAASRRGARIRAPRRSSVGGGGGS